MKSESGFSLVELLIVIAIVALLATMAVPQFLSYRQQANKGAVIAECRQLFLALNAYHQENGAYPDPAIFDLSNFNPLRADGYYTGNIETKIFMNKADNYNSLNQDEFWLFVTQEDDAMTRLLVADSDEVPLAPGKSLKGVFLVRNGVLQNHL